MINVAHPLSILLISAVATALIRLATPSLAALFDRASSLAAALATSWIRVALIVFGFSIALSVIPSLIYGVPVPLVHDEFAYLLQGDTFAHGRLTNPPHAMSEFLETFHVLQHPTYAAKFPIGQGAALAIGFRLGLPIIGVWASVALACVAVAWALRGVVSPRLALLGALLCSMHPLIAWWSQSYWGGGVAMLGGALLIGAVSRLRQRAARVSDGLPLGLGLAILAISRPLEGLIFAILLLPWAARSDRAPGSMRRFARPALPLIAILAVTALVQLHYNKRVTGNALTLPYVAHARQYMIAPLLFAQPLNTPEPYHHQVFADFYEHMELHEFRTARWWRKPPMLVQKYVDPATLIIPLIASLFALRQPGVKLAWFLILALPMIHMLLTPWMRPQYMAPLIAPLSVLTVFGLRELTRRRAHTSALFVVISQVTAAIVLIKPVFALSHAPLATERARLVERLANAGGKHLVIVSYGPRHEPLFDFVFNSADIDGSPVVFARSMGINEDRKLLNYFRDHKVHDLYYDDTGVYRVTPR